MMPCTPRRYRHGSPFAEGPLPGGAKVVVVVPACSPALDIDWSSPDAQLWLNRLGQQAVADEIVRRRRGI